MFLLKNTVISELQKLHYLKYIFRKFGNYLYVSEPHIIDRKLFGQFRSYFHTCSGYPGLGHGHKINPLCTMFTDTCRREGVLVSTGTGNLHPSPPFPQTTSRGISFSLCGSQLHSTPSIHAFFTCRCISRDVYFIQGSTSKYKKLGHRRRSFGPSWLFHSYPIMSIVQYINCLWY